MDELVVTMPQLGESVAEGTVERWLAGPGDRVAELDSLVAISTDKVEAEVPSPATGVLREILADEGSVVPVGAPIAILEVGGGGGTVEAPEAAVRPPDPAPAAAAGEPDSSAGTMPAPASGGAPARTSHDDEAVPSARCAAASPRGCRSPRRRSPTPGRSRRWPPQPREPSAAMTACPTSAVVAVPPRSPVLSSPAAITSRTAASTRAAATSSPR
jgi:pyruvate/2-oxoglutarate dehydrogenase complex dihydrolipoamide acyltransferase (E2) component